MQHRRLGHTDLEVAPLVFGANVFGWTADKKTSFDLLDRFVAAGLNAVDTADVYSAWAPGNKGGESETIFGEWIKARGKRSSVVVITKVGSPMGPGKKGLKAKYIDSGRAKFILREFPLDPLATAGFMFARCAGPDKRNLLVDQLYSQQKTWAFVDKPIQPLLEIVKQVGMSQADFETCLKNQDLYDQVNQSRDRAAETFNIDSTPTFFINGRKLVGELTLADFDKWLDIAAK